MIRVHLTKFVTALVIFTGTPVLAKANDRLAMAIPPTPQISGTFMTMISDFAERKQTDRLEDLKSLSASWLCEGFDPGSPVIPEFSKTVPARLEISADEIHFTFINSKQIWRFKAGPEAFVDEQTVRDLRNQLPASQIEGHAELKTSKAEKKFWVDFQISGLPNGRGGLTYECEENPEF